MQPADLDCIARFRRHLATERRLSAHTDSNYARDLQALAAYCDAIGIDRWAALDSQHLRQFAARSHARGLSPRSIQRRLCAVRTFFEFLLKETPEIKRNPARDISAPKAAKTLPKTLDADRMARLLETPRRDELSFRDHAIMELFYSSGLRLAELIGLDLSSIDLPAREVRVRGKGNKERIVPIGRKALEALEAWFPQRRQLAPPGETALFVGRNGRRLSPRAIQKRVAYWARRQGVGQHVHPHLFRHSFASHLLESGAELRGVQELLGHANLSTTQIYTHLDFQHLARIYDASHPRAKRKKA